MEVVLDRDAFLKGLQMVQNIVEPRQTLPILANVLLETDGETVRLTATDLEVGARVTVPARVTSKGAITISARKLAEIVKELPLKSDLSRRAPPCSGQSCQLCPFIMTDPWTRGPMQQRVSPPLQEHRPQTRHQREDPPFSVLRHPRFQTEQAPL